eukprot:4270469-Amphidinium_carterae.1
MLTAPHVGFKTYRPTELERTHHSKPFLPPTQIITLLQTVIGPLWYRMHYSLRGISDQNQRTVRKGSFQLPQNPSSATAYTQAKPLRVPIPVLRQGVVQQTDIIGCSSQEL